MEITDVRIFKTRKSGPVLGYANVILGGKFIIRGITLLENQKGRFISMPSRQIRNEGKRTYRDVCHPLNNEVREELTEAIFETYDEFIKIDE